MLILIARSFMSVLKQKLTLKVVPKDCFSIQNSSIVTGPPTFSASHQQPMHQRPPLRQLPVPQRRQLHNQAQLNQQPPNLLKQKKKLKIFVGIKLTVYMPTPFVKSTTNVIVPELHILGSAKMVLSGIQMLMLVIGLQTSTVIQYKKVNHQQYYNKLKNE